MHRSLLLALGLLATLAGPARADETNVAVAANFTGPAKIIADAFTEATGHVAVLSFGSTGQLYTQISQGAPFQVFLAADQARPEKAVAEGLAVAGSQRTYAIGTLVLWSADASLPAGPEMLTAPGVDRIALANPATAPYGAAAMAALESLGMVEAVADRLVQGNNIAQTFQFVTTGNAQAGFVAGSQLTGVTDGVAWTLPGDLYPPIRQDAVLLTTGADNPAARAFLDFLAGPESLKVIQDHGYAVAF
ncbi:molybdate ABC transporter substrate-binding protein [Roseospirillum parvum]|uniref:Molybdate transport system substrate-binding protein n=1 Tax=Roseospirillum parvum TaxID=83401 RepID=A0A1G8DUR4_9PROT|nr:molybdate ABC transporter substrate-binding protein [Roseospirillum parvum]SDH61423.1 molybdate transport system substrate-binding protein [Roseospirillum parvum]